MKKIASLLASAALALALAAPVLAAKPPVFDYCPNLDGIQRHVPHGYVVIIDLQTGDLTCVPA
jgi:hypothetical protein